MEIKETIETENYTRIRFTTATPWEKIREMEQWCIKTNTGKKVSMLSFAFRTKEEYMMFLLRWQ